MDERLVFLSEEEALTISNGAECLVDRWWIYLEGRGVLYFKRSKRAPLYPQCNSDKRVAELIREKMYPWAEVKFFPIVYSPSGEWYEKTDYELAMEDFQ